MRGSVFWFIVSILHLICSYQVPRILLAKFNLRRNIQKKWLKPHILLIRLKGFNDLLNKILENDSNLPPPKDPGMKNQKTPVTVEFLPSKKAVKAFPGTKLSQVADAAGVTIRYKCLKGECNTCAVKVNGVPGKACQLAIPTIIKSPSETFHVEVLN